MLQTYLTALFSYMGTTTDYVVVLLLLFSRYRRRQQVGSIVVGAYLGNVLLVLAALAIALVLKNVPDEWILGLLGLLPIAIGIKNYFSSEEEEEGEAFAKRIDQTPAGRIILVVITMTIAACGADNMALYIPYFTLASTSYLPGIFLIFALVLTAAIVLAYRLARVAWVSNLFERFGDLIQVLVYVLLGIYILFEAGTIQHLLGLL